MAKKNKDVDISVEVKHETKAAVLVTDGDKEVWLPKSLIKEGFELTYIKDKVIELTLPEWLCLKNGLI